MARDLLGVGLVNLSEIEKKDFVREWEAVESPEDGFAWRNLQRHRDYQGLRYYVAEVTNEGLSNLVLAHHRHPNERVRRGGEPFWHVINAYWQQSLAWRAESDDCLRRIDRIIEFLTKSSSRRRLLEPPFVFVSNERALAIPGEDHYRDHGLDSLYAGSFHQWVACGFWIRENGYHPIRTYYCEKPRAQ